MQVWKTRARSSNKRSLLKTLSWRTTASIDTFLIAWFVTGAPLAGGAIALGEILTKLVWYYLHERIWAHIDLE
ncbi:MAG: DUF2061 domain-containing protein [Parvibaculum sp.]|uniref:DUF2061 domain-containing protein n=1 Tax=Parvibaculum sp. TaxID=2024848 RepID=UPI003C77ED18